MGEIEARLRLHTTRMTEKLVGAHTARRASVRAYMMMWMRMYVDDAFVVDDFFRHGDAVGLVADVAVVNVE